MAYSKEIARKGVNLLFVGEVLKLLSAFSALYLFVAPLEFLSFLAIIGAICTLVGIIKLRNTCVAFNNVFFLTIIQIILSFAGSVFTSMGGEDQAWASMVSNGIESFNSLFSILVTYFVIAGCGTLIHGKANKLFGLKTLSTYATAFLLTAVYKLTLIIGGIFSNETYIVIGATVVLVFSVIAYVFYIILLGQTRKNI